MEIEIPEGYKLTEVGIIPEEWNIYTIKETVKLINGCAFKPKDWKTQGLPIIRIQNLNDPTATYNYYNAKIDERYYVKLGDILFAWSGTKESSFGARMWLGGDAILNQHIFKVIPENEKLTSDYVLLVLQRVQEDIERKAHGFKSSFVHVKKSDLENIQLPLPPLPEQKAIAQALSDVDAVIAELDGLITKKRNIKQATMQQLLTGKKRLPGFSGEWEEKKLGEIGECIIGLTYKPENVKEDGLLVLRSSNIADNQLKFDDNVFVDVEVSEKLITKEGDILICVRNGSRQLIGKTALIDKMAEGLTFGAFMSVYRTKFYEFVFHAFQSNHVKRQIHENIGATINQITNKNLSYFQILLPPLEEQKAIAQVLSDMDTEIEALEQKRNKYKAIKQGMMQELLTGRTRLI
jgi:type I restriction enzyme S subunit